MGWVWGQWFVGVFQTWFQTGIVAWRRPMSARYVHTRAHRRTRTHTRAHAQVSLYLERHMVSALTKALTQMCHEAPGDPFMWLANWLLENNPNRAPGGEHWVRPS